MKSKYTRNLNNANIILGIHIAFKLVIILTLFIVLYTTIWVKEIYLTILKSSTYIQIFIFLTLSIVMLALNNPKSMDICNPYLNYFYLIVSILELGIIICEIYFLIKNLNNFLTIFHECPYYRTYEEISNLEYKRSCLYYLTDFNNELPYKYICYYNSENEYLNKFCDGLICGKNNNNKINSYIKCYGNIDKNSINFDKESEFFLKEEELIMRYKSSNLYACFRNEKLIKNENIFNKKCPDSNPIKKMLIFIYSDIILHLLIDFLFIYEFYLIQKINKIYLDLVALNNRIPINILSNDDVTNSDNRNANLSTNKQTLNSELRESIGYPQSQIVIQRDNSQTIIIEPEYANNKNNNVEGNNNDINKNNQDKYSKLDSMEIQYNESDDNDNDKNSRSENNGIINRKAKIFNFNKKKDSNNNRNNLNNNINNLDGNNNNNNNEKNKSKKMVIIDVKKDEEYGINRINIFIRKKSRKKTISKENDNKDNLDKQNEGKLSDKKNIKANEINKIDNKIEEDKKYIKNKNLNNSGISSENIEIKNSICSSNENESLKGLNEDQKNKMPTNILQNDNEKKFKKNKSKQNILHVNINNSNILLGANNNIKLGLSKELSLNNLNPNNNKNNSGDKIIQNTYNTLKNDITKNSYINKLNKSQKSNNKNINNNMNKLNENDDKKEDEKEKNSNDKDNNNEKKAENININNDVLKDKNIKKQNEDNKAKKPKKSLLDNIHINSEVFLSDE